MWHLLWRRGAVGLFIKDIMRPLDRAESNPSVMPGILSSTVMESEVLLLVLRMIAHVGEAPPSPTITPYIP